MDKSIEELTKRVTVLEEENKKLRASTTIPFDVDRAFRERFRDIVSLSVSAKGVDTEDVTVNESGASSYPVMNDPDGFLQITINGITYYLPYFS